MKKAIVFTAALLAVVQLGAQEYGDEAVLKRPDTVAVPSDALGIGAGYFLTWALSYQHYFTPGLALDLTAGFRTKEGWSGGGPNTRLGGIAVAKYHFVVYRGGDLALRLFPAAGLYAAEANYGYEGRVGPGGEERFFVAGTTFGAGLDIRYKRFNLAGQWMPGQDFTDPTEYNRGWFLHRCNQVALRYVF